MAAADHTMEEVSAVQRGAAPRRGNTIQRPQMAPLDTQRWAADVSFSLHCTSAQEEGNDDDSPKTDGGNDDYSPKHLSPRRKSNDDHTY
ncbi:hypothetical protein ZWY2020_000669 [Hordeum vulgare]|nr:hypothetical protein ZWY2020_000669 [Hordeum vulgare]